MTTGIDREPFNHISVMRKKTIFLQLLLGFGLSTASLAQTSSTLPDSVVLRIHRQDSLYQIEENRINSSNPMSGATQAAYDEALDSLARVVHPPTLAAAPENPNLAPDANGRRYVFDTGYIVNALRYSHDDLTAICAHRGYFQEAGVPENSLKAIQRASDATLEIVELDIKMSRDGVPVLSHDYTVGRTTVGGNYNPVAMYNSGQLQGFLLKDRNGFTTQEHMPTLEQALDYIRDHRIAIVVALDIKDRNATMACWEIVKRKQNAWSNPAYNWVIFKVNATVYPYPRDLARDISGMLGPPIGPRNIPSVGPYYSKFLYIPVYTTNMVDKISCLNSMRAYKAQPFTVAIEINYKETGGILSDLMNDIHEEAVTLHRYRTKAVFNALPDAGGDLFWGANGHDKYRLSDLFYRASNGARDTKDLRGDWAFITNREGANFHMLTTDEPFQLAFYLGKEALRNTTRYRPHLDGTDDEVDPHSSTASRTAVPADGAKTSATRGGAAAPLTVSSTMRGVYPNPTTGPLTVSLSQAKAGTVQLRLTDQTGRTILTQEQEMQAGTQQVQLPNLREKGAKPGLYLLQVTSTNGQPKQTFKVQVN